MSTREFDIVVYGPRATPGAWSQYLAERCAAGLACRWAMAGRSQSKLEAVRDEIGAPSDTPWSWPTRPIQRASRPSPPVRRSC